MKNWDEAEKAGLRTKTQWKKLGRTLRPDAEPADWYDGGFHYGRYHRYPLYRENATRPKRIVVAIPPKKIDLLAAIFAVTRAAKRFREAADRCYRNGMHAMAGRCRETKERCYELKDRGIVAAVKAGRIEAVSTVGNLIVYRGEGFCFHSLLRPIGWTAKQASTKQSLTVEAKPRGRKEPRLKDAQHTLGLLPVDNEGFERIPFAPRNVRVHMDDDDESDWIGRYEDLEAAE